jgi:hypothetical protein
VVLPASRGVSRVPRYSGFVSGGFGISVTGLLPSVAGLSRTSSPIPNLCDSHVRRPTTPPAEGRRFGLFPFRSPLLRESLLLSLPQGTKMFQFPWYAPIHPMDSGGGTGSSSRWVAPFGNPRITACLRLPEAFRSSPRPSSAPGAKASTVRPFQLHLRSCSSYSVLFRCYRDLAFHSISHFQGACGGAKRIRTADPLLARQVLSQLSYSPI